MYMRYSITTKDLKDRLGQTMNGEDEEDDGEDISNIVSQKPYFY